LRESERHGRRCGVVASAVTATPLMVTTERGLYGEA
jgi:hypothetical protein